MNNIKGMYQTHSDSCGELGIYKSIEKIQKAMKKETT